LTDEIIVWKFASVFHKELVEKNKVKSFWEKLVMITEIQRQEGYGWRYGDVLVAQESFAPVMLQRMQVRILMVSRKSWPVTLKQL
jgi:hypothetical protein